QWLLVWVTVRGGVCGGALFRIGNGAMPFVLPLMLQLGFGLSPLGSGLLTFVSAVGSLFMKTMSAWILRKWGFRMVLTVNAVVGGLTFAACGLFSASTPHAIIFGVLLVRGCFP